VSYSLAFAEVIERTKLIFRPQAGNARMMEIAKYLTRLAGVVTVAICTLALHAHFNNAEAEYGDIIMNEFSADADMRPVVFPHWFHRIRFRCKVCHGDLGFAFKAGGNSINMLKIIDGDYCGACHDGGVAWSIENCDLCHSGVPGTPTQVHHSTAQKLIMPVEDDVQDEVAETDETN